MEKWNALCINKFMIHQKQFVQNDVNSEWKHLLWAIHCYIRIYAGETLLYSLEHMFA